MTTETLNLKSLIVGLSFDPLTATINLFSILENQELMSRAKLESLDIEQFDILDYVQFNDGVRFDDKNYINLSLSGPNTFLFERFRQRTSDDVTINWCVLKIDPKYIFDESTLFAVTNAASNAAKSQYGISGDFQKFNMLFKDHLVINSSKGRPLNRMEFIQNIQHVSKLRFW